VDGIGPSHPFSGCSRFDEIVAAVPGLTNRLLSKRLTELEDAGLVVVCEEPRPRYSLTELGRYLNGILAGVADWNQRWGAQTSSEGDS
jgi:DNA-binding HxlR family transcriptional regulator